MKKIIFITGVAGMVGSNLLNKLKKKNKIIIGLDNLVLGKKKNISPFLNLKNFFFFKYSLNKKLNSKKIEKLLKSGVLSEVWMLAANSDIQKGVKNPKIDLNNTFLTTVYTMRFVKKFLTKNTKILFASSSAIYGNKNKKINENTKNKNPISNYGKMKLESERFLDDFSKTNKGKYYIFRFPNVVGKNLTHGILFDMKKKVEAKSKFIKVLGDGNQQKPYSYVDEILKCMNFIKNIKTVNRIDYFNIGNDDKGIKVKSIVKKIIKKYKSKKQIIFEKKKIGWAGDIAKYSYSTQKIKKLGFNFKHDSNKAIDLAINNL